MRRARRSASDFAGRRHRRAGDESQLNDMDAVLGWAWNLDVGQVIGAALFENVILFLIAIGAGNAILRLPTVVRLLPDPGRISRLQVWRRHLQAARASTLPLK